MVFMLGRLVIVVLVLGVVYYIVKAIFQPSNTSRCSRCDGKGFWYDARGKEKCDWCKGSGTLPRDFK